MATFSIKANPTFPAKVAFPIAGSEPVTVGVTFKHRTKSQLNEFIASREAKSDVESFMDMVCAWELSDPFNAENVTELLENHIGVAVATYYAYMDELTKHRRGN